MSNLHVIGTDFEDNPDWAWTVAGELLPGDTINHPDTHETVVVVDITMDDDEEALGDTVITLSRGIIVCHADDLVQLVNRRNQ